MTQYSLFDLPDEEAEKIEAKKREKKETVIAEPAGKITPPPPEKIIEKQPEPIIAEEKEVEAPTDEIPTAQEEEKTEYVIVEVEVSGAPQIEVDESIIDITAMSDIGRPNKRGKAQEEKPKSKAGRKSIQEMAATADLTRVPADDVLYQKQYYSIGAVAEMFRENVSLIRYWANEFKVVNPRTNKKGDRHFRPQDIKNLQLIHHLLRQKKYTLEGAKDFLKRGKDDEKLASTIMELKNLKDFLLEMKASL